MFSLRLLLTGIVAIPLALNFLLVRLSSSESGSRWFSKLSESILLPFALGTLLGDVFLHTLPHIYSSISQGPDHHNHHHHHHHHHHGEAVHKHQHSHGAAETEVGVLICAGILVFALINRWIHSAQRCSPCSHHDHHSHSHHSNHSSGGGDGQSGGSSEDADDEQYESREELDNSTKRQLRSNLRHRRRRLSAGNLSSTEISKRRTGTGSGGKSKKVTNNNNNNNNNNETESGTIVNVDDTTQNNQPSIPALAITTLVACTAHTITDGFTLGITYYLHAATSATVYAAALAILLHEIPHKLADYAILIKSGLQPIRALSLQLLTSLGLFAGALLAKLMVHGAAAEGDGFTAEVITAGGTTGKVMAVVTGGLIYNAMCGLLPQVLGDGEMDTGKAGLIIRLISIAMGVYLMALVGSFE